MRSIMALTLIHGHKRYILTLSSVDIVGLQLTAFGAVAGVVHQAQVPVIIRATMSKWHDMIDLSYPA